MEYKLWPAAVKVKPTDAGGAEVNGSVGTGETKTARDHSVRMDERRLERFLRSAMQSAGRQYAEAKAAYHSAKRTAAVDLPVDDAGNARIVCRRYAEQRTVPVDADCRPACYDAGHPDCDGCVEDIREGRIETWC